MKLAPDSAFSDAGSRAFNFFHLSGFFGGAIATERQEQFADHVAPVLARIPSRRMSTPAEVAAAVVFLASDDAANIHGAVLSVDGGWAAV